MEYQNVITIKQRAIKSIHLSGDESFFRDKNYQFLRQKLNEKGPMTIKEIMEEFKKEGNPKSEKTIYRYLGKLKNSEIVIPVGKKILLDENQNIRSETLYGTSAKFFLIGAENYLFSNTNDKDILLAKEVTINFVSHVLRNLSKDKKINKECFSKFIAKVTRKANQILVENMESSSDEMLEYVMKSPLKPEVGRTIMDLILWLGLILQEKDIHKDFEQCLE
ncbi:MAG: hypothetical protein ACTSSG_04260 [Candidatus Heimdallarchaeaceae archaeon]